MKKALLIAGILLAMAAVVYAEDYPKGEIYGGWAFVRTAGTPYLPSMNMWGGFGLSGAFNFHKNVGIVGDFSYHRKAYDQSFAIPGGYYELKEKFSNYYFLFGPQFTMRSNEKVEPFFRVMAGLGHAKYVLKESDTKYGVATQTKMAYGFGGGIDVKVADSVYFRVIQMDYIRQTGDWIKGNIFRMGVGLVFKAK
jgi:opacity protein-like surface antigen